MKVDQHPSYRNPVVIEALCEFHFELASDRTWRPAYVSDMYTHLSPEGFSEFEPVSSFGFRLEPAESGFRQILQRQDLTRFRNITDHWLVQIGPGLLTVNVLPKYPGWDVVRARMSSTWEKALKLVQPACLTRVGLRYINALSRKTSDERASAWLTQSAYLPRAILDSLDGYFYRLETKPSEFERLIVTLAERDGQDGLPNDIVFDIECSFDKATGSDSQAVLTTLDGLHARAWDVFSASSTSALETLMNEGPA